MSSFAAIEGGGAGTGAGAALALATGPLASTTSPGYNERLAEFRGVRNVTEVERKAAVETRKQTAYLSSRISTLRRDISALEAQKTKMIGENKALQTLLEKGTQDLLKLFITALATLKDNVSLDESILEFLIDSSDVWSSVMNPTELTTLGPFLDIDKGLDDEIANIRSIGEAIVASAPSSRPEGIKPALDAIDDYGNYLRDIMANLNVIVIKIQEQWGELQPILESKYEEIRAANTPTDVPKAWREYLEKEFYATPKYDSIRLQNIAKMFNHSREIDLPTPTDDEAEDTMGDT